MLQLVPVPAQVLVTVRWFEHALEHDHFSWAISGERFFVRVVPLLFGVCAFLATEHTQTSALVAAIWPANGLLLAALLLSDSRRLAFHTAAACFATNVLVNLLMGKTFGVSLGFSAANAGETCFAFILLHYLRVRSLEFGDVQSLIKFIVACAAAALAPSLLGAALVTGAYGANFTGALVTWYTADLLGLLLITPAFALAFSAAPVRSRRLSGRVPILLLGCLVCVCAIVFGQREIPLLFLVTPCCVAIAFQMGTRYAAFATLFLAVVSIVATYAGYGPAAIIAGGDAASHVWLVQLFCLINHFTTLFVATAVAEREAMKDRIQNLSATEQESRRNLDDALDAMNQGLCLFDSSSRIVARNDRFLQIYQLDPSLIPEGLHFNQLTKYCATLCEPVDGHATTLPLFSNGDADQILSDGRTIRISQRRTAGDGVICTYTDITAERQAENDLRHISLHDQLTGLPNRRCFASRLHAMCQGGGKADGFRVMLIDVDHFKRVNDTYGHAAGDQVLHAVSSRLGACVRDSDMVARIGGDEFAVILADTKDDLTTLQIAKRMLAAVEEPVAIDGAVGLVTLSIGVAPYSEGISSEALMKQADEALYRVKQAGRNDVAIFQNDAVADSSLVPDTPRDVSHDEPGAKAA